VHLVPCRSPFCVTVQGGGEQSKEACSGRLRRADTVLRYGCVLTVAVCHSRCLRASSIAPSRTQLLIGE
jgi:hypothetical protein